jgi:hypothetical protein
MQLPSEKRSSSTVLDIWLYNVRVRKTTCNPNCIFLPLPAINCGELLETYNPSWATDARATMKQRDRYKGKKESLGKETDILDPDEHLDVIALMLEPPASCCACGEGLLVTFHWKSCCELWKSFCNMLHRVILYCLHVMTS